jgi:hypothetical protein
MSTITSDTVYAVAAELGFLVERFETTRAGDADSLGNGNWLVWQGEHTYVLRRYHVLRTEEDLAYESDILGFSCQGQLTWTAVGRSCTVTSPTGTCTSRRDASPG